MGLPCRKTLPDGALYVNGPMVDPKLILTDNCQERNALKALWPFSILLLYIFSCSSTNMEMVAG